MQPFARRKPHALSGGQRQRVALARSLVKRPRVLLLDEPLAALDKQLRTQTQFELIDLQARLGTTFVIVTHDQEEAMTVAGRIAVMQHGRIVQVGTPAEIYEQPNSRYVAGFVGDVNLIEGRLAASGPSGSLIDSAAGIRLAVAQRVEGGAGVAVWLALRPEKVRIAVEQPPGAENCVAGRVSEIAYLGNVSVYKVRLDNGFMLKAQAASLTRLVERPIKVDDRVWLSWTPDAGVVLTG
jgi:putrescine transport system ATP-binding protein